MQSQSYVSTNGSVTPGYGGSAELFALLKDASEAASKLDSQLKFQEAIMKYIEAIDILKLIIKSMCDFCFFF